MNAQERRIEIQSVLKSRTIPIKGMELARIFGVSRQIIVQDMAILRAEGFPVIATPKGYITAREIKCGLIKQVAVKHSRERLAEELEIMLKHGAKVLDVIIEHPIYGEIRGTLNIKSSEDLNDFLKKVSNGDAESLCAMTNGVHIHTVEISSQQSFEAMMAELKSKQLLI